jgi:hypothetical protein
MAVHQPVEFACGLRATEFVSIYIYIYICGLENRLMTVGNPLR